VNVDTRTVNVLSICSGYGGIELGLRAVIPTRTVCYVENEIGCASILAARMEDGSIDQAPIWTDLRTFDPEPWRGKVDILAGGFPCQPHSVAGNKLGEDDPRELSGEVLRVAAGLGYPTLFLENVPGILRFYFDNIRPGLQDMGYEVKEGLYTAAETGAPHKRQRLFILAHAERRPPERLGHNLAPTPRGAEGEVGEQRLRPDTGDGGNELAHAGSPLYPPGPNDHEGWAYLLSIMPVAEPTFCRDADGAPTGLVQRLRAIGNGVVPAVAALAFRELASKLEGGP
jgi:DNA (cytosine-5)-methyltransferase 1